MKKDIKIMHFLMLILTLMIIEFVIIFLNHENNCNRAICSSDGKSCYIYKMGQNNKLEIEWKGSCKISK